MYIFVNLRPIRNSEVPTLIIVSSSFVKLRAFLVMLRKREEVIARKQTALRMRLKRQ